MPTRLLLTLFMLLPSLAFADLSAENLQSLRTKGFSLCNHLLVYYNPNQNGADPRHAELYREALQQLQQTLAGNTDTELQAAANAMQQRVRELEQQPTADAQLYPRWINPLLQAHATFDNLAAARYANSLPESSKRLTLHTLSLNIDRLQLVYQTRIFGSLAVYVLQVDQNTVALLDGQIAQGFDTLAQQAPEHAAELAKLRRKYDYVRPRLLQHALSWVPSSAAYYLNQITDRLAQLDTL